VLTGSGDGTARLWEAASGQPLGQPMQHTRWVGAVAFSPDGQTVLTGSEDGTARLWKAASGQPLGQPMQHKDWVRAVAFSPDGQTVLTGSGDGTARLWQAGSGQPLGQPMQHKRSVGAVAFSPDGQLFLVASERWAYEYSFDGQKTVLRAARLLPGRLPGWNGSAAFHWSPGAGECTQVAVLDPPDRVFLWTLRFDEPAVEPLTGDPKKLLAEWQRSLALEITEDGRIEPRSAVADSLNNWADAAEPRLEAAP